MPDPTQFFTGVRIKPENEDKVAVFGRGGKMYKVKISDWEELTKNIPLGKWFITLDRENRRYTRMFKQNVFAMANLEMLQLGNGAMMALIKKISQRTTTC